MIKKERTMTPPETADGKGNSSLSRRQILWGTGLAFAGGFLLSTGLPCLRNAIAPSAPSPWYKLSIIGDEIMDNQLLYSDGPICLRILNQVFPIK
jgi:hypothetical protein